MPDYRKEIAQIRNERRKNKGTDSVPSSDYRSEIESIREQQYGASRPKTPGDRIREQEGLEEAYRRMAGKNKEYRETIANPQPNFRYDTLEEYDKALEETKGDQANLLKRANNGLRDVITGITLPDVRGQALEEWQRKNREKAGLGSWDYTPEEIAYSELKQERNLFELANIFKEYQNKYVNNEDFDQYASQPINGIVPPTNIRQLYGYTARQATNDDVNYWIDLYNKMTDEEKALYNYLQNSGRGEEAFKYLTDMDRYVGKREYEAKVKATEKWADSSSGVKKLGRDAFLTAVRTWDNAAGTFGTGKEYIDSLINGSEPNPYKGYSGMGNYAQDVTQIVAQDLADATGSETVAPFLYQTVMSTADSLIGAGLFGENYAMLMGTNAFNTSYRELTERGASKGEVIAGALLSGAAETVFEKVSLERLLRPKDIVEWRGLIKETLKQAGVEASEETFTELANIFSDQFVNGPNSEAERRLRELKASGLSDADAKKTVASELQNRVIEAAIGGALSGGLMSFAANGAQLKQNKSIGQSLNRDAFNAALDPESKYELENTYGDNWSDKVSDAQLGAIYKDELGKAYAKNAETAKSGSVLEGLNIADETTIKGEAAELTGFKKYGNNILLKTSRGEVNAKDKDVKLSNNDAQVVTIASKMTDPTTANAFVANYKGQDIGEYYNEFQLAHVYGKSEAGIEEFKRQIPNFNLDAESLTNIYEAGVAARTAIENEAKQAQAEITKEYSGQFRKGSFVSEVTNKKLNSSERVLYMMAQSFSEMGINVKVIYDKGEDSKNGEYNEKTNTVTINLAARYAKKGDPFDRRYAVNTMAHELTHWMEPNAKTEYAALKAMIWEYFDRTGIDTEKLIHDEMKSGISRETAESEVIARACEDMLSNPDTYAQITANANKSFHEKFKETVLKVLDKIKDLLNRMMKGYGSNATAATFVRQNQEAFEKFREQWIKTFDEALKFNQALNESLSDKPDSQVDIGNVSVDTETNTAVYSRKYTIAERYEALGYKTYNEAIDDMAKKIAKNLYSENYTKEELAQTREWLTSEESIASIIMGSEENRMYWDYDADDHYVAIKKNSDYPQGTVDLSNNCPKREIFTSMFDSLQKANPGRIFTAEDIATIRQVLAESHYDVACALCYVEDRRQKIGEIADTYINMYKDALKSQSKIIYKINNEGERKPLKVTKKQAQEFGLTQGAYFRADDDYIPNQYDLVTYEGFRKLHEEHPSVARAFENYNNSRGMQAARLIEGHAEYKREILKYTPKQIDKINRLGGLRIFSFSDFQVAHLIDIAQVVMDCAAMGVKIQVYTKVPSFAALVKDTNIKINRSLIPATTTSENAYAYVDGKVVKVKPNKQGIAMYKGKQVLAYDTKEGVDINDKNFLDMFSNPNVGNVCVGISDEQIRMAMLDEFVDYIIPFHSSQSTNILHQKGIGLWKNYKDEQEDKKLPGNKKKANHINIYDVIEKYHVTNKYEFFDAFIKECAVQKYVPRFERFLNKDANGNYVYTEGYHKLLLDYKMFDQDGNILPQQYVKPDFDSDLINEIFEKDKERIAGLKFPEEISGKVKEALGGKLNSNKVDSEGNELSPGQVKRYELSQARDDNGNLLLLYRGTTDVLTTDSVGRSFFTSNLEVAKSYSGSDRMYTPDKNSPYLGTDAWVFYNNMRQIGYNIIKSHSFQDHISGLKEFAAKYAQNETKEWIYGQGYDYHAYGYFEELYRKRKDFEKAAKKAKLSLEEWVNLVLDNVRGNYAVYADVRNPIVIDAKGKFWYEVRLPRKYAQEFGIKASKYETDDIVDLLYMKDSPYDGVIIKNVKDSGDYAKNLDELGTDVIVKDVSQIGSVANLNPTEKPDIRNSDKVDNLDHYYKLLSKDEYYQGNKLLREAVRDSEWLARHNNFLSSLGADIDKLRFSKELTDREKIASRFIKTLDKLAVRYAVADRLNNDEEFLRQYVESQYSKLLDYHMDQEKLWAGQHVGNFGSEYNDLVDKTKQFFAIKDGSMQDSTGELLTEGQVNYFKRSKVRDEFGRLLRLYHGTIDFGFTVFNTDKVDDNLSFFFSDNLSVAGSYSGTNKVRKLKTGDITYEDLLERFEGDAVWKVVKYHSLIKITEQDYEDPFYVKEEFVGRTAQEAYEAWLEKRGNDAGIYEVYVNCVKPYIVDANYADWNGISVKWADYPVATRDIAEYAHDHGYDGVIIKNVWDEGHWSTRDDIYSTVVIAFKSNQIKSTSNENPTDHDDILLSDKVDDEYNELANRYYNIYEEEKKTFSGDVKRLTEAIVKRKVNLEDLNDHKLGLAADALLKEANSAYDRDELIGDLFDTYRYIVEGATYDGSVDWDAMMGRAYDTADKILSKAKAKTAKDGFYSEIIKSLKNTRVHLNDAQIAELKSQYDKDWNKVLFGKIRMVKDPTAISLDSLWHDLSHDYPDIFKQDVSDTDQPLMLIEAINDLNTLAEQNARAEDQMDTVTLAESVYEKFWNIAILDTSIEKAMEARNRNALREQKIKAEHDLNAQKEFYEQKGRIEASKAQAEQYEAVKRAQEKGKQAIADQKLADDIFFTAKERKAIRDRVEKDRQRVKELVAQHKQAMKELKSAKDTQLRVAVDQNIAQQKLADSIYYGKLFAKYKEKKEEDMRKYKEYKAKQAEARKEEAQRRAVISDITDMSKTLADWMRENGKKHRVPEPLKRPVGELLNAIDYSSKRLLGLTQGENAYVPTKKDISMGRALEHVRDIVARASKGQTSEGIDDAFNGYIDFPPQYADDLTEISERVNEIERKTKDGAYVLQSMSLDDLLDLKEVVKVMKHTVSKMNSLISQTNAHSVDYYAQDTINFADENAKELKDRNKAGQIAENATKFAGGFINFTNGLPYYVFKHMGDGSKYMFSLLQNGWDKFAFNIKSIADFTEELYTDKEVKEWTEEVHDVTVLEVATDEEKAEGKENTERNIKLTTAQIMSLYCLAKREQAKGHILGGGVRIADFKDEWRTISQSKAVTLTESELARITDMLTDRQKEVADELQKFMNTTCSEWGNEVTMKRFGIKAFTEENYFPIKSDTNVLRADVRDDVKSIYALLNMSFTKELVKNANNQIVVDDIFNVFTVHASDMAKYNSLALPVLDTIKWWSYSEKDKRGEQAFTTRGVKTALANAYGNDANKYIRNLLSDINGAAESGRYDGLVNKMTKKYKIAAVGANLSVALLQPISYARAIYNIDKKYLVKGLAKKPSIEKCKQYAGIALWKSLGFYDTNINMGLDKIIKHADKTGDKLVDLSLKLAETGDSLTWGYLWNAVEAEISDTRNLAYGSEAFNEAVAERLREILYSTQVFDSTLSRSDIMRAKGMAQPVTAFMSEPTVTVNMMNDARIDFQREASKNGLNSAMRKHGKQVANACEAYVLTATLEAVVRSVLDKLRDNDDDETFLETFLAELKDALNPLGKIPFLKDFVSIFQGYSPTRMDTSYAQSIYNAYKAITKVPENGWTYKTTYKLMQAIGQTTGLPLSNAMRELATLWNNTIGRMYPDLQLNK